MIGQELRIRIVTAYRSGLSGTYAQTAKLFGVGEATVSRLLRRYRETGNVEPKLVGGNHPRHVDLQWLRSHAERYPDARLRDRAEAWQEHSGSAVSTGTMSRAMHAIGWTHKKNTGGVRTES